MAMSEAASEAPKGALSTLSLAALGIVFGDIGTSPLYTFKMTFTSAPRIKLEERFTLTQLAPKFWRADVRFGFMETPDIPLVLSQTQKLGCDIDLDDVTYYLGHETIVARKDGKGVPLWEEGAFALMLRNSARLSDFLKVPTGQVVEIGRQVEI